uniref:Uncharacterized protein n=1 Tax=Dromaius novaehollandiae TaxID=8790 RepID=A0A8C4JFT6_DRONO
MLEGRGRTPATMQDQKTDINQQIQELRTIISLQGDAPSASVGCPDVRGLWDTFGDVEKQAGAEAGAQGLQWGRDKGLQEGGKMSLPCSPVSSHMCFQMAREKLQNDIFDRVNVCNMLLYELRQRDRALDELQRQLQHLMEVHVVCSCWARQSGSPGYPRLEPSLLQVVRQLENNIEKTLMKVRTGQKVTTLYLAVRDILRKLAHLPVQLDVLNGMVEVCQGELKGMELMAFDAFKATDAAKVRTWPRAPWDPLSVTRAHSDPAWTALGSQASESSCNKEQKRPSWTCPWYPDAFVAPPVSCSWIRLPWGSSLVEAPAVRKASLFHPSSPLCPPAVSYTVCFDACCPRRGCTSACGSAGSQRSLLALTVISPFSVVPIRSRGTWPTWKLSSLWRETSGTVPWLPKRSESTESASRMQVKGTEER